MLLFSKGPQGSSSHTCSGIFLLHFLSLLADHACDVLFALLQGIEKHLKVPPQDLELYIEQMEKVLRCYVHRLRWLLSGVCRVFSHASTLRSCFYSHDAD